MLFATTVGSNCRVLVQWMKTNAAATGIVNRIRQQVIDIHNHCSEHG